MLSLVIPRYHKDQIVFYPPKYSDNITDWIVKICKSAIAETKCGRGVLIIADSILKAEFVYSILVGNQNFGFSAEKVTLITEGVQMR